MTEPAVELWQAAYLALKDVFGLAPPAGPPVSLEAEAGGSLRAFQCLDTPAGPAALEVHQAADAEQADIWVAVPRAGLPGIAASRACDWFHYRRNADDGAIVPAGDGIQVCPPYGPWPTTGAAPDPQPVLRQDGDWAHGERYL